MGYNIYIRVRKIKGKHKSLNYLALIYLAYMREGWLPSALQGESPARSPKRAKVVQTRAQLLGLGSATLWPVGEAVNTLPFHGSIQGFESLTGHQLYRGVEQW